MLLRCKHLHCASVAIALSLVLQGDALAVTGDDMHIASEADLFADIPFVATSTRLSQPANETPVSVTATDREMIETSGVVELMDVLRLAKTFRLDKVDAKFELIGQNLGSDYNEFTSENNFETRVLARAGVRFH